MNKKQLPEGEIQYRNPIKQLGFAQVEHVLTLNPELSDGAYRTYALLKFYTQQKGSAFPSVNTLAEQRGCRRETISAHLKELVQHGLITREPRVGTSTMTYLEDFPKEYQNLAAAALEKRNPAVRKNSPSPLGKSNADGEENLTQRRTTEKEPNKNNISPVSGDSVSPQTTPPKQDERFGVFIKEVERRTSHITPRDYERLGELWDEHQDIDAHIYALDEMDKRRVGFNHVYYEKCLFSFEDSKARKENGGYLKANSSGGNRNGHGTIQRDRAPVGNQRTREPQSAVGYAPAQQISRFSRRPDD